MKVYIAGPITGDPNYKAKFQLAQRALELEGKTVISPAVLPEGMTPADYMRICFAMIDSADVVAFLPGWNQSKGASLEHAWCQYTGKQTMYLKDMSAYNDAAQAKSRPGLTEITVKFKESQRGTGEDVYWSPERKRHYIRQESNITDPPAVFWLTCTKGSDGCGWSGYEASSPLRAGLIMQATGPDGQYFEETLTPIYPNGEDTMAVKAGKFSWEVEENNND